MKVGEAITLLNLLPIDAELMVADIEAVVPEGNIAARFVAKVEARTLKLIDEDSWSKDPKTGTMIHRVIQTRCAVIYPEPYRDVNQQVLACAKRRLRQIVGKKRRSGL